jgi:low affinity Fe/Cu permease
MNRFLFVIAEFLSRPPGFYFVLTAMVLCTLLVPFGLTNVVTYALSVAAIIITGVVLPGISRHLGHPRQARRDHCCS